MYTKKQYGFDADPTYMKQKKSKAPQGVKTEKRIMMISLSQIAQNPLQARKDFDQASILSLADSIRKHGLLQPILVRKLEKSAFGDQKYLCVAGERRLRAFKMLSREQIPCLLISKNTTSTDELSLVENLLRKDLTMFEFARALSALIETYRMTQEELADKLSTTQSTISNKLRLLRLTQTEQEMILENNLSERHARALLRIQDRAEREKILKLACKNEMSVLELEQYIESLLQSQKNSDKPFSKKAVSFDRSLERMLAKWRKDGILLDVERREQDGEIQLLIRLSK